MKLRWLFSSRKRIVIAVVVLLVVAGILWAVFGPKTVPEDQQYTVTRTTLEDTISFAGEIDADQKATVQFPVSGKLAWVGVKEGDYVQEGQTIASLDQQQLQKQMQRYLNTFGKARNDFDQDKEDYGDKIPTQADDEFKRLFANSQFDLNNAILDVEIQNLAFQNASISTPISGIVTRVDAPYAGVNITLTSVFEVMNPGTVYFSATIDQTDLPSISEGLTGNITLDAYPEEKVSGTVQSISFTPIAGETGTVYEAKVNLLNMGSIPYRLGMTGDITFTLGKRDNVLVIPIRFLKTEGDDYFVNKKEGNSSKKVEIEIGEEYNGNIEVTKGLSEGDIIYEQQ